MRRRSDPPFLEGLTFPEELPLRKARASDMMPMEQEIRDAVRERQVGPKEKIDLVQGKTNALCKALTRAAQRGALDSCTGADLTGKQLAALICSHWCTGHEEALRNAYTAGKWHATKDDKR